MVESRAEQSFHPEGLTPAQERLADLYITVKIKAKVRRRDTLSDGSFKFTEVEKEMTPFSFAQEGEFALKLHEKDPGAPLSPYYINQRELPEEVYEQIGIVLAENDTNGKPDVVTGIPKAGTPIAKAYAKTAGVEHIDIFDKELTGIGRRIVGKARADNEKLRLRIADDLVTGADTKFEAINAAEKMGFEVEEIWVIIDREQGGKEELAKRGYKLKAAFTVSQLLDYYLRTEKITKEKYDESKAYLVASKNKPR
jgi:orotate phosphoribosyltransferase